MLVAINAAARFAEVAIPGPGGFTPISMLIILAGYVFGGRFGFLMGAMTLLVSAVITGGLGRGCLYQMFTAGWVGLSAPLARPLVRALGGEGRVAELVVLAVLGALWGFAYGAIEEHFVLALRHWPGRLAPGTSPPTRCGATWPFYVLTSLVWDAFGAFGNVLLIVPFGAPVLRALRRFRDRIGFAYQPDGALET